VRAELRAAAALALAVAAGVAMSFGQTYAPDWLQPLFNSAAPVVAIAGLVAFAARRSWSSALLGALSGPAVMAGYYLTSEVRGFANSASWIVLWSTAGVLFGAVMGWAVWLLRHHAPIGLKAPAAALWPGVAIGEAAHGLARIADSTPIGYWWTQAAVGAGVLAAVSWYHLKTWPGRLLAAASTVVIAAVVFAAYGLV
jgi:hypothetical protein